MIVFYNEMELDEIKDLTPEEFEQFKLQSMLAQAETFEKMESDKMDLMLAIAEVYETFGGV